MRLKYRLFAFHPSPALTLQGQTQNKAVALIWCKCNIPCVCYDSYSQPDVERPFKQSTGSFCFLLKMKNYSFPGEEGPLRVNEMFPCLNGEPVVDN